MSNTKVRKYPAFVKESVCGPEITIAVNATSLNKAHDIGAAYCKKHNLIFTGVGMPQR